MTKTYDVLVETQMGIKTGSTTLTIEGTSLSGTLTVLGHTNEFSDGTIDAAGNVAFAGKMWTPFGKIPYTLTGTLIDDKIEALTKSKIGNFKVYTK